MSLFRNNETAARGGPTRRTAPVGGALNRGRGCHYFLFAMILMCATPALVQANTYTAPSGLAATLLEFVDESDQPQSLVRARFVAPELTPAHPGTDAVLTDLEYLCNTVAIPHLTEVELDPMQIVVSLSAEALELGVFDPDIPQYFEAFSIDDGLCIWELY